ncbi:DUF2273 domain-containing protein [Pectinatus haikarae]|uniref:Membrane protein n=1 Tax=Pectinatus haikarae TaxID=349096 RepID=A0ABT9Y6E0_9FIRM|nr:DUF2273 domain-containing protein [Pectinatus haikarae]MDQ0203405.1 putative membrane protein [Pectinatus haikarae]
MENFSWKKCIKFLWDNHRGKSLGIFLGLIISLSILIFGFFKTLFVLFFIGIGLFIGNKIDRNDDLLETAENILDYIQKFIPPVFRR